jgi:alpha-glucosidase
VPDGQWYLHMFDTRQPDFNWDHPQVRAEFADILRFWLDRGVDGFRVDVAHGLVKRLDGTGTGDTDDGPALWDQDGVHEIYRSWHEIVAGYGPERILVAEAWVSPVERLANYVRPDEMHQAFNFDFLLTPWNAERLRAAVSRSLAANAAVGAPSTWVLSNHDVVRHASRLGLPGEEPQLGGISADSTQPDTALGLHRARAATLLMLALPGSAYLYQGEELGLPEHTTLPGEVRQDPTWRRTGGTVVGRDGCRVPIPWEGNAAAYGFSGSGSSWLPQPEEWRQYAVDHQKGVPGSTYEMYRAALRLRRERRLGAGELIWLDLGPDVLAFINGDTIVLTNFGSAPVAVPGAAEVVLASGPLTDHGEVPTDVTVWARLP